MLIKHFIILLVISCTTFAQEIKPYLQSSQATSIHISWQSNIALTPTVEYGITSALGNTITGGYESINGNVEVIWNNVKLVNLVPNTVYYYKCISDTLASEIHKFKTQPSIGLNQGHIRFGLLGDNRTVPEDHSMIINGMKEKMIELYGEDIESQINLVINVGDIVENGWTLSQYQREYFEPVSPLSATVPFMVSIGNHENESDYYYQHMKYEEFGGTEGEKYYNFKIGRVLFIGINSNWQRRNDTQIAWLDSTLQVAQNDETIDWVFSFCHHPGISEVWPAGNTAYVQDRVVPTLEKYSKSEFLFYGHSHNYERGATASGNLRLMLNGGGGSSLDRWRMYNNQTDYPEIQRSFDHYCYSIFDIDIPNRTYTCLTFSMGHKDKVLNNVLIDSFSVALDDTLNPASPSISSTTGGVDLPFELDGGNYTGLGFLQSSQFQITDVSSYYDMPILDSERDFENIYFDTGSPEWLPIDKNSGVDISKIEVTSELLPDPGTYFWRVRYRASNLRWSDWSNEGTLDINNTGFEPIVVHNKSLNFDGENAYIEITDSLDLTKIPQKEMTVELWVKIKEFNYLGSFIGAVQDNGTYEKGWFLGSSSKSFVFGLSSVGADDGDGKLTIQRSPEADLNKWYHLAGVYDGTNMMFFINGFKFRTAKSQSGDILYDVKSFFNIGAYHDDNKFLPINGELDEIRLWNTALSDSIIQQWMHQEINEDHPQYDNLLSYWNMNNNISDWLFLDDRENNNGVLRNMNKSDLTLSTSPIGQISKMILDNNETEIGPNGANIKVKITSKLNEIHYLGAYYFGINDGSFVENEEFPDNVTRRFDVLWGLEEHGQNFLFGDEVVADVSIYYGSVTGAINPDSVRLLKRKNAASPWIDVNSFFEHDKTQKFFSINGISDIHEEYSLANGTSPTGIDANKMMPYKFDLSQSYPNPFNPSCTIPFELAEESLVQINIYDVLGRRISVLVNKRLSAGKHQVFWNARNFSTGVYYIRMDAGTFNKAQKIILLK